MPKIVVVPAGKTAELKDVDADTIHVIALYGNGANGITLTKSTSASLEAGTFAFDSATNMIEVPAKATDDDPIQYLVSYERTRETGMKLTNKSDEFSDDIKLTLLVSIADPCSSKDKAAYIVCPSVKPDPSMTISFDSENQETDFTGNIQSDYCSGEKVLYFIYFPDEDAVVTAEEVSA